MPSTVTPLTGRSLTLINVVLIAMVTMAVSPLLEVVAIRWPLRFGDPVWQYDTLVMVLSNGPQLLILLGVVAIAGTLTGSREIVRAVAAGLFVLAAGHVVTIPLLALDFLQVQRLVAPSKAGSFKLLAIKSIAFGLIVLLTSTWVGVRAWQASEKEGTGLRRKKGQGLVVGQDESPRKE